MAKPPGKSWESLTLPPVLLTLAPGPLYARQHDLGAQTIPHFNCLLMADPDLAIIIVNWNSAAYVRACLRSVLAHTRELDCEIVVVDSASYDGCDAMLAKEFTSARYVQCQENVGFGRANNLGAQHCRARHLLFLNPDTELSDPAIQKLLNALVQLPQVGAVGPRLINTDGSLQDSCIQSFPTLLNQVLDSAALRRIFPRAALWGMAPLWRDGSEPVPVEGVVGASLMIKRTVFEEVGGFSPEYFMYAEDMDLCFKTVRAGYRNYYVPSAVITHHGGKSSEQLHARAARLMCEAIWQFLRKFRGSRTAFAYRCLTGLNALVRWLLLSIYLPFNRSPSGAEKNRLRLRKWWTILAWSGHWRFKD